MAMLSNGKNIGTVFSPLVTSDYDLLPENSAKLKKAPFKNLQSGDRSTDSAATKWLRAVGPCPDNA